MKTKEIQYFKLFRDVSKVINSSLDLKEVLKLIDETHRWFEYGRAT